MGPLSPFKGSFGHVRRGPVRSRPVGPVVRTESITKRSIESHLKGPSEIVFNGTITSSRRDPTSRFRMWEEDSHKDNEIKLSENGPRFIPPPVFTFLL